METKPRTLLLLIAASLLSASLVSAAGAEALRSRATPKSHFVGVASWYGLQHQGLKMANGKRFDRRKLTAASWYVPLGTVIRVVNLQNGKTVTVTVTDRGPNFRLHRILDLSEAAARELGYIEKGVTPVFVSPILSYEPQHAELNPTLTDPQDAELLATFASPMMEPSVR